MSLPNNIIQQQNVVLNQLPSHAIMSNVHATNVPIVNAVQHTNSNEQGADMKPQGMTMVNTIPSNINLSCVYIC